MPEKEIAEEKLKAMESEMIALFRKEQKSFQEGCCKFSKDSANMSVGQKPNLTEVNSTTRKFADTSEDANKGVNKKQERTIPTIRKNAKTVDEW